MDYWQIINDLCDKNSLDCYVYEDGDYEGKQVLQVYSNKDLELLNNLLKEKFKELGVDTSDIRYPNSDDGYVNFATDDNWVYSDESYVCDECYKLFRMETYGYANYFVGDGFIVCPECMKEEPETYLETLINNYHNANTLLTKEELEKLGFEQIGEEYENGWYGQRDNPKKILEEILENNPDVEVIFDITKTYNPFATRFTTYIRRTKEEV